MTEIYFLIFLEARSPRLRHPQGWFLRRPLSWACSCLLLCFHVRPCPCVCVVTLLSYKDAQSYWIKAHPMPSCYFNYLFKGPISKHSHKLEILGLETSMEEFWGRRSSAHNIYKTYYVHLIIRLRIHKYFLYLRQFVDFKGSHFIQIPKCSRWLLLKVYPL